MNSVTWRKILMSAMFIALCVDFMIYTAVIPIMPLYFREAGTYKIVNVTDSKTDQTKTVYIGEAIWNGYFFAIKNIVRIIASPIGGVIGDKFDHSKLAIISQIFLSVSTFMFAFLPDYWELFAARAIQGFGEPIFQILMKIFRPCLL